MTRSSLDWEPWRKRWMTPLTRWDCCPLAFDSWKKIRKHRLDPPFHAHRQAARRQNYARNCWERAFTLPRLPLGRRGGAGHHDVVRDDAGLERAHGRDEPQPGADRGLPRPVRLPLRAALPNHSVGGGSASSWCSCVRSSHIGTGTARGVTREASEA